MNIANECPDCLLDKSKPLRKIRNGGTIYRERQCRQCKRHFYTIENAACPDCKSPETTYWRGSRGLNGIRKRTYYCNHCKRIFDTEEINAGQDRYNNSTMKYEIISENEDIKRIFKYKE